MAVHAPVALATATKFATGGAPVTSDSYLPEPYEVLIVIGSARVGSTTPPGEFDFTHTSGLTWTNRLTDTSSSASNPSVRQTVWTAQAGASPSAFTVTLDTDTGNVHGVTILRIPGGDPSVINIGSNPNANGDPAPSISAPAASSLVIGVATFGGTSSPTSSPLATELSELETGSLLVEVRYTLRDAPSSGAWASANTRSVGMLIEVKAALRPVMGSARARAVVGSRKIAAAAVTTKARPRPTALPVRKLARAVVTAKAPAKSAALPARKLARATLAGRGKPTIAVAVGRKARLGAAIALARAKPVLQGRKAIVRAALGRATARAAIASRKVAAGSIQAAQRQRGLVPAGLAGRRAGAQGLGRPAVAIVSGKLGTGAANVRGDATTSAVLTGRKAGRAATAVSVAGDVVAIGSRAARGATAARVTARAIVSGVKAARAAALARNQARATAPGRKLGRAALQAAGRARGRAQGRRISAGAVLAYRAAASGSVTGRAQRAAAAGGRSRGIVFVAGVARRRGAVMGANRPRIAATGLRGVFYRVQLRGSTVVKALRGSTAVRTLLGRVAAITLKGST